MKPIDFNIADTLLERPICFTVRKKVLYLYPLSLGKVYFITPFLEEINIQPTAGLEEFSSFLLLYVAKMKRESCLRLIAYCTLKGDSCLDEELVRSRIKDLRPLKASEIATLISTILSMDKSKEISGHFHFDTQKRNLDRIQKIKEKDRNSISIGGSSVWGTLVDFACQRYGWTVHYVVWDISLTNLNFLLEDHIKTVFLTDKERKEAHISSESDTVINVSDTDRLNDLIKSLNWR